MHGWNGIEAGTPGSEMSSGAWQHGGACTCKLARHCRHGKRPYHHHLAHFEEADAGRVICLWTFGEGEGSGPCLWTFVEGEGSGPCLLTFGEGEGSGPCLLTFGETGHEEGNVFWAESWSESETGI